MTNTKYLSIKWLHVELFYLSKDYYSLQKSSYRKDIPGPSLYFLNSLYKTFSKNILSLNLNHIELICTFYHCSKFESLLLLMQQTDCIKPPHSDRYCQPMGKIKQPLSQIKGTAIFMPIVTNLMITCTVGWLYNYFIQIFFL